MQPINNKFLTIIVALSVPLTTIALYKVCRVYPHNGLDAWFGVMTIIILASIVIRCIMYLIRTLINQITRYKKGKWH